MENKENEVKKCKHCQSDIPKKAKICPNCRKKQGGKLKFIIAWIFFNYYCDCFDWRRRWFREKRRFRKYFA